MTPDRLLPHSPAEWARLPRAVGDPLYGDFALGEFVSTAAIGDLRLDVTAHPVGAAIAEHAHPSLLLLFVLEGELEELSCGRISVGRPGSLLVRPEGVVHAARMLRRSRLFSIEPGPAWLEQIGARDLITRLEASEWTERLTPLMLKVYGCFTALESGPAAGLALQGYLQALLAELVHPTERSGAPLWLRDTRQYLDAHLGEPLRLDLLARRAGVHPVHLSRSFRKHYGVTLTDYLRQGRLVGTMIRLSTTDDAVSDIARDAGFSDPSHFTREFRRLTGDSPAGYRAGRRGRPPREAF